MIKIKSSAGTAETITFHLKRAELIAGEHRAEQKKYKNNYWNWNAL